MNHPWDLHTVWSHSSDYDIQLQCVQRGIVGYEASHYATVELFSRSEPFNRSECVTSHTPYTYRSACTCIFKWIDVEHTDYTVDNPCRTHLAYVRMKLTKT